MCGIAGLFRPGGGDDSMLAGYAARMTDTLAHRGPDASGVWTNAPAGIAFGHRRLSILDLSEAGAQPMRSDCGRFTVTFNGEIYNHLDIRGELEASGISPNWRGHSDTETLLYAVRQWGVAGALQRFIGMFAFATVGRAAANANALSRPLRRKAVVLRMVRPRSRICVGTEGARRSPGIGRRSLDRTCADGVYAVFLRSCAGHHLAGHQETSVRHRL